MIQPALLFQDKFVASFVLRERLKVLLCWFERVKLFHLKIQIVKNHQNKIFGSKISSLPMKTMHMLNI